MLDINKLQDGKCVIDGKTREIVDVDIHYNDSNLSVPNLPKTLITKDIIFKINNGIDPATGARSLVDVTGYKCRLERYNKTSYSNSGDTKQYDWIAYIPMENVDSIHHIKLYLN